MCIIEILYKYPLAVIRSKSLDPFTKCSTDVIEVLAVVQLVLCQDEAVVSTCGGLRKGHRKPAAGVGAAEIDATRRDSLHNALANSSCKPARTGSVGVQGKL